MSYGPDFPDWFICALIISAIVGLITIVISIISGIVWLYNHVTIV